jgi:xylulose-5-phosphate/fructose-6-phosphate phosphoketolase
VHGHPDVDRNHVRGFNEQGTTTTPFQMVVMNQMNRFHLAAEAIRRIPRLRDRRPTPRSECDARIAEATAYAREHLRGPTREPMGVN